MLLAFRVIISDTRYGNMGEMVTWGKGRKVNKAEAVEMLYINKDAAEEARPVLLGQDDDVSCLYALTARFSRPEYTWQVEAMALARMLLHPK